MSDDTFTKTTTTSWGSRLGSSFKGILAGILLVGAGIYLLFWNEGRTVKNKRAYKEGATIVISASCDNVNPKNEGKLVHISGQAITSDTISDPDFGITANAISIRRSVQMYQWEENQKTESHKKLGGSEETKTTYTYKKVWSTSLNNSENFEKSDSHQNPAEFPYSGQSIYAQNVTVGSFTLSEQLIKSIGGDEVINIRKDSFPRIEDYKITGNELYIGKGTKSKPKIGDIIVSFTKVTPKTVSIIGRQTGSSFTEYTSSNGRNLLMLENSAQPAEKMFQGAIESNKTMGWILRALGLFIIFLGFSSIFKPLSTLADVVPFIGSIVGFGTGIISAILTIVIGFVVIAIAWIYYRPVISISLLSISALLIVYIFVKRKKISS